MKAIEVGSRANSTQTTRTVSHDEAKQIALRLIRGAFRRDGEHLPFDKRPNFSIPTRVNDDDDCLIVAYIEQQAAIASGDLVLASAVAAERERCAKAARTVAINAERRAADHGPYSEAATAALHKAEGAFAAEQAIRALSTEPASGEFVVVPRVPTEAMLEAGGRYVANMVGDPYNAWNHFTGEANATWTAILNAATKDGSGAK